MNLEKKGILVVVSGFSGSGKGTIMKELLKKYPEQYALSISATTRQPREGETDGVEYFFKETKEFEQMIADGELLEYAQYVDNYYGTPKAYVEKQLADGKDVILEIEIQGALKVKKQFPQTLLLFVTPPSAEILKERLIGRGTEDMEIINKRLSRACEEAEGIENYDYLVINDDLDICVEEVHQMIRNEHLTIARNEKAITQITMIHPSYVDLMKVMNSGVEFGEEPVVNSRYSIVIAASKRARQIIAGDEPLVEGAAGKKPLSTAVQELYEGKVKIIGDDNEEEEEV